MIGRCVGHVYYVRSGGRPLACLKRYNVTILSTLPSDILTEGARGGCGVVTPRHATGAVSTAAAAVDVGVSEQWATVGGGGDSCSGLQ